MTHTIGITFTLVKFQVMKNFSVFTFFTFFFGAVSSVAI